MKHNTCKKRYLLRLEISFLLSLIILIGLFYFYPRFNFFLSQFSKESLQGIIITDIPITRQISKRKLQKPSKPWIPVESDELEITENINIIEELAAMLKDSGFVLYYPNLKYQRLPEKFSANMLKELHQGDSLYAYGDYLMRKLKNLPPPPNPNMDGSDLARDIKAAKGLFPGNQVGISFSLGGAVDGISKLFSRSSFPSDFTAKNIINVKQDFLLLQQLWENGPQTTTELLQSKSVSEKYTYQHIEKSLIRFFENGLVIPRSKKENEQKVEAVYSLKEMIRFVAEFYDITPKEQKTQREILANFLHRLIMII
jgi:hypothetical protein